MNAETVAEPRGRAISILGPSPARMARLGAWFEAEYPALLRFAHFVTGDRAAAEDLVQDAFVRLYRAGARLEDATFPAYARKTILNLGRSGFRRRAVERRALEATGEPPPGGHVDHSARDEVWRAILALSPQQRACVALRYYEDLKEQEIAETLGMSLGAVKKQTHRAMKRLRESLGDRRET